ncbi:MAG TPA: sugar phosphate isomerase/epimerase [Clostridiales bacterium]|jgi:L-ribulose-5-phosphate 3-epimerase|nr:sugar phosphate isomerase/epimerase [Clostridiales bacterium]
MKLSNNTSYIEKRFGIEKAAVLMKKAGFTAMDYSLHHLCNDEAPLSGEQYRKEAEYIRKCAAAAGIGFNQTHAPFKFKDWDTNFEDVIFPKITRSLEITAILGAEIAVVHPLHHFVFAGREEEIFELNMNYYRRLIPYAREYGVKIAIENMWQTDPLRRHPVDDTCSCAEEFIRYIDTLDSEYIVACLDLGHVGLIAGAGEAEDIIRALGHDRLKSLHVHDNNYRDDQHLIPGLGKMHWDKIAGALGEIDYTGDLTFEAAGSFLGNYDDEFFPTALRFMAEVGGHLIDLVERSRITSG